MILERDAEQAAIGDVLAAAGRGSGGLVVVEGPAGIGKTALLRAARDAAARHGLRTLAATASPLDREFPFGLVHQLLDPVVVGADEAVFAGTAARARAVLGGSEEPPDAPSHALLHGLYWLCANLAERESLLLSVDDLHWADGPSLRFLEFLGRRLDGLAVAVVAATRPREPGAEQALLDAIAHGPDARLVTPSPLSADGTRALVAGALGQEPEGAFVDACLTSTGGNPLLLRELARAAAEQELAGTAADAGRAQALGSAGIAATVARRLDALGPEATTLARCAAVLGDRGRVQAIAIAAGLGSDAAWAAAEALVGVGILETGTWEFVHPLVREAVLSGAPAGELSRLHALAAVELQVRGARPEEIALHLLATAPGGDPVTVHLLRGAARGAQAEGALDAAAAYLRRALDEPPAPPDRPGLLLELGELEMELGAAGAADRLAAALGAGLTGDDAVRARAGRARIDILRDLAGAIPALTDAARAAVGEDLRLRLQTLLLDITAYEPGFDEQRAELLRDPEPSPVVLAHRAQEAAYRSAPAAEVAALARQVVDGGRLLQAPGQPSATYHLLIMALRHAEQPDLADVALRAGEAAARAQGSRYGSYFMDHARAYWEMMFGSVTAAEAHARSALEITEEAALPIGRMTLVAMLAEVLMERGQLDEAERHIESIALTPELERVISGSDMLGARSELHRLRRRFAEAEADARRARELVRARGWTTPLKSLACTRLAAVLIETGRAAEALDALEEDRAAAARAGTPGIAAAIERVRGRALGGAEGITVLEDAIAALDGSRLTLERAWALYDLGFLLRRESRRSAAREPLRRALDEATRIGAGRLAAAARDELLAAGGRPRREALSGPDALTPSERRVADLAITGLTNREIAETLWVTRKTVELHLGAAYAKLGIRSRGELADALG